MEAEALHPVLFLSPELLQNSDTNEMFQNSNSNELFQNSDSKEMLQNSDSNELLQNSDSKFPTVTLDYLPIGQV